RLACRQADLLLISARDELNSHRYAIHKIHRCRETRQAKDGNCDHWELRLYQAAHRFISLLIGIDDKPALPGDRHEKERETLQKNQPLPENSCPSGNTTNVVVEAKFAGKGPCPFACPLYRFVSIALDPTCRSGHFLL